MRWTVTMALGLAVGVSAVGAGVHGASAQMPGMMGFQAPPPSICNDFLPLRDDAQKKGAAIGAAEKRKVTREELCKIVTAFSAAEEKAGQFLAKNKAACGVPDQALGAAKEMHAKTVKFREMVCAPAPQPKVPTLSDAMGAPALDTAKNTKTGAGTFDTLTGNPLAK